MHLRVASKNDGHCISSFQSSYVRPVRVSDVVIWSNRVPPQGLLLASNLLPSESVRSVGLIVVVWIPNPSKALYHGGAYGTTIVG